MEIGYWALDSLEIEQVPLCPLCGQPLFDDEEFVLGSVDGGGHPDVMCLVHRECALAEDNEDEDEE